VSPSGLLGVDRELPIADVAFAAGAEHVPLEPGPNAAGDHGDDGNPHGAEDLRLGRTARSDLREGHARHPRIPPTAGIPPGPLPAARRRVRRGRSPGCHIGRTRFRWPARPSRVARTADRGPEWKAGYVTLSSLRSLGLATPLAGSLHVHGQGCLPSRSGPSRLRRRAAGARLDAPARQRTIPS